MKRALITGINGMDGSHLADLLLSKGYRVWGMERRVSYPIRVNTAHLEENRNFQFISGDVTDQKSLINVMKEVKPNEIYNLAAQSFVGDSWNLPHITTQINAVGALNMLEATRQFSLDDVKYYQASTSEMYGNSKEQFAPRSPYGISKLFAHHMTINYRESFGMFAVCGILFNHESERRGIDFVTRKITDGVARISLGMEDHISLGNLDAKRDWGYAPDYVEAMWLMLQQGHAWDCELGTGENHSVAEFVKLAFEEVDIPDWQHYVRQDQRYMRPADVECLLGDPTQAKVRLGWKPSTPFKEIVRRMVREDLRRLGHYDSKP